MIPTTEQTIRHYPNQGAANAGMRHMANAGWHVTSQSVGKYRKAGCLGWLTLGIFTLLRGNKARDITVTYSR